MTTQAQALKLLRDFLQTPTDATLRRDTIRYLAHQALIDLRKRKRVLDDGFGDRLLCPRCWGEGSDEIGKENVACRVCNKLGTVPKP